MAEYINDSGDFFYEDEISQFADEQGTTFEDIVERNGLKIKDGETGVTIDEEDPKKKKAAAKRGAPVAAKSTASKSVKPSSVSSNNPFGETKPFDPLGLEKVKKATVTKPVNTKVPTGQGYKYDSRGYLVPKDTKEPSLWDDIKDFAKNLFPDSEEDNNGKLTYYEQTPIKEQQDAFNRDSKEAMSATGKFEFLKNYKPEDRALFVSKLVPKTNYTEKRYNKEDDTYYIAPKQEAVDYIMKDIDPTKFKTKAQLDNAIALNTKKLASQDKAFEFEQQYAKAKAAPLINSKIAEIKEKYSLTTPESVAKATKELQDYAAKTTTDFLVNSQGFQGLNQTFASIENEAKNTLTKQYERSKETELSFFDKQQQIGKSLEKQGGLTGLVGTGITELGRSAEGLVKSGIQIGGNVMQGQVSTKHGEINDLNNFYNKYKDRADNEKFNLPETWNDLMAGAEDIGQVESLFGNNVPKTFGEARERLKTGINKINSDIESKVTKIADTKDYIGLFNQADLKDGVQLDDIFTLVGEQTPNLILTGAAAATGNPLLVGLSTANIFTQEYGSQYYDTIETGLREDLGRTPTNKEIAEAIGKGKYANRAEAIAGAALSAGLEYASELNIIKNTGKALGLGNDAKTVLGSLFRGEIKNFSKSSLQQGARMGKSGLGEYLTESVQQGIAQATKGIQLQGDASKYIDLREINEAGETGGLVGIVFPFAGSIATQTGIEVRAAATKVATMFDLSGKNMANLTQVNNFFKEAAKNVEERFKVGDITKEQKQTELETLGTIRSAGVKIPTEFASEAKEKALGLMLEKANIEKAIDGKDKDLVTPETERLKDISLELATIAISERERIRIDTNKETLDKSIGSIETIVDKEGNKVYETALGSGKSVEVFENTEDAQVAYNEWFAKDIQNEKNKLQESLNNNEITQEEFDAATKKLNEETAQDISKTDGFALKNGQILINKERAAEVGALNVAPHELLHNILKSEFSDPKRKIELRDAFLKVLSKAERTKLDKRMELYTTKELEDAPDEYMTQYFELLRNGTITWSDNVKETLISLWNSVIKPIFVKQGFKNIEFEDGRDIYNFIKDYSKSIKKGKISERASGLLKAGEVISGVTKFSKTVEERIEDLYDAWNAQEIGDADFEAQLAVLEEEEANGPSVQADPIKKESVKKEITTKEPRSKGNLQNLLDTKYDGNPKKLASEGLRNTPSGSVTNDFSKSVIGKELGGTVETITRRLYDPIAADAKRGVTRDEYKDALIQSAALLINNEFDPSKQTLDKFISSRLNLRANALAYELGIEGATKGGIKKDVEDQKALIAEETVTEAKEKPKYKNALESKVFPPEVLETAYKKIITVMRTLKSRIDAPVSLNRTVTPLISEIKDEIGKLLDIDIKTMLGGKKDGVLRKELLRTKRYILENMTTTWLMGKDGQGGIPQAIQKQIDGKWVNFPDWAGKKIDREKTTTDQAGRTSGAEIVRRLPNAVNNISDEVFLAQIIGPDGNPIRGRKESLSKAMAEEGAFDIINNDFETGGPIFDAFQINQERLGVELVEHVATEISRQIERGNIKLSLTADLKLTAAKLFDVASEFGQDSKEVKNILNKLPLDDQDKLKEFVFEEYLDFLIKYQDIKEKARGTVYERMILKELNKLKLKGVKIITKKAKGFDPTGEGDINIQLGEDILNIEVKLNALAQMGSASLDINLDDKDFSISKDLELPEEFTAKLKANIPNFKEYKKAAESIDVNTKTWPYKMMKWQHEYLRDKGFQKALTVSVDTDQSIIEQLYNSKNVYYINIGNQGLFYLGKDILNLGVPQLESKVRLTARMVRGGEKNRIRLFPTLIDFKEKSKYNIDNAASNNALFTKYKQNLAIRQSKTTEDAVVKSLDPKNSVNPKGISVFDFDDTVGLTKSNVLYTMPGDQLIYHGAPKGKNVTKISDKGVRFFATDVKEANEYARMNSGVTQEFVINNSQVADESVAINKMKELGLMPKNKEFEIDDAQFYELIDTRFEESLSKADITKLFDALKKDNVKALRYDDGAQVSGKSTISIAVIDPSVISAPKKLSAEEFAKDGASLLEAGAEFNFSEFSKVVNGKPGPMVEKMKKMIGKFGSENFFILTARPANSAIPIHEFLSSIGIDIPLKNITGLGSSLAQSKADWITAKASEGYNDFYFADDAIQNVEAVKNALEVLDVKSKIQQARIKFSKTISPEFNKIIEENTGMEDYKVFSDIVARRRGADKNKFDFYVPPSAADFELLLYKFVGKGTRGEEQKKFFSDALLKPYANGNDLMDATRQSIKNDYKALTDQFPNIRKEIEKLTPDGDFTYDQAIRVAMWTEEGVEIPGISQRDQKKLTELVNNDPELNAFKEGLIITGRQGKGWVAPTEYWDASTIISDLHNLTEGEGRKKFLAEFIDNTQEMFGKWENGKLVGPNINKVEAVYGTNVREAIEDVLYRMTTGKNRSQGSDKETSAWSNWVNGSTGTIMFLNTRSAALQLIGAVNFLNLRDNNPIAAGKAFANQKQYWEDFALIWNSDKMKERRGGLKEDVAAAEIANAAAGSKNKANAVISYLLKIGYTPTQLADSFAIASGGSPFYRNRIKTYLKEGQTQAEAEANAWSDFTKVSDETQQSGDPRDISKQQASGAGRLLLTFQNTAMQQSRIVKKSFLDLKNGRGDAKTHIAKITYYLAIQNIMFAALQQGLFAVLFSDDDKDEEGKKKKAKDTEKKMYDIADGVLDTILRGTGFTGGIIATLKNMYMKYTEEQPKDFKADYTKVVLEGANISPPIGSKLRKLYSGFQQTKFERDLIKERGWGVMQDGRVHLGPMYSVTGKGVEAITNVPMDRLVNKIENVSQAMNSKNTALQRVMVGIGFTPYSVGIEESEGDKSIKKEAKKVRAVEGKIKAKETRQRTKDSIAALPMSERLKLKKEAALKRRANKLEERKRKQAMNKY